MEPTKTKSMKKNKSKGKNGMLPCFKPATLDDSFEETSCENRADPVLTYFAVAEKGSSVVLPTTLSSALSMEDCTGEARSCSRRRKKNDNHRSFWQVLKRALNERSSSGKKKSKKKATTQKLCRTSSEPGEAHKFSSQKLGSLLSFDNDKTQRTNSNDSSSCRCSSAFTASSLLSTSSTSLPRTMSLSSNYSSEMSRTNSTSLPSSANTGVTQESAKAAQGRFDTNNGLFLLMISLLVLILCGKCCAILCTSIWLFVAPRRSLQCNRPAGFGESKLDSVQYKKKVIMEGLLERRRSRLNTAYMAKS